MKEAVPTKKTQSRFADNDNILCIVIVNIAYQGFCTHFIFRMENLYLVYGLLYDCEPVSYSETDDGIFLLS